MLFSSAPNCVLPILQEEHYGYSYIVPIICFIGIICNIITLTVLASKMLDGTSYTYLTALAVADTITLAVSFPVGFSRCNHCYTQDDIGYMRRVFEIYVFLPFNNMTTTMSVWITTALALERYVFVYHPIKAKKFCKVMFARRLIASIGLCSVILNISYFFTHRIDECNHTKTSSFGKSVANTVIAWVQALLVNFIPSILLTTFSIILLSGLVSASKNTDTHAIHIHNDSQFRQTQNKFTATLVAIIVLFLLGHVPIAFAFTGIAQSIFTDDITYKRYRLAANLLQFVTFSSNFFIYCALDSRFIRAMRRMYCLKCSRCCSSSKCKCRKVKMNDIQVSPNDSSTEL